MCWEAVMALVTRPAWVLELKRKLPEPYTLEEMARIRQSAGAIRRLNAGKRWPAGTFQRRLDLAHAGDEGDSG
jgi:hypothetical protein